MDSKRCGGCLCKGPKPCVSVYRRLKRCRYWWRRGCLRWRLVPHLLLEAAFGRALLALGGFERVVLELLLEALSESLDLLMSRRDEPGKLDPTATAKRDHFRQSIIERLH